MDSRLSSGYAYRRRSLKENISFRKKVRSPFVVVEDKTEPGEFHEHTGALYSSLRVLDSLFPTV